MKRFKKILAYAGAANANDPALLRAGTLAKNNDATVELVDVIEELPAYVRLVSLCDWDVEELLVEERKKKLQELAQPLSEQGVNVRTKVLAGSPARVISQHVLTGGYDLLLKTARPEPFLQRLRVGTLAKQLMRICPCPVWIIQPDRPSRFERIVAAIDPDDKDDEKTRLNTKIIEMASSLSEQETSELHIIHAWSAYGETLLQSRWSADEVAAYVGEHRAVAQGQVDRFLARFDNLGARAQVHLLKGDPQAAIVDFVTSQDVDLVVMGTISRAGISGLLIGNTAETVLRSIGSSVLAVKPDGFRSPVADFAKWTAAGNTL